MNKSIVISVILLVLVGVAVSRLKYEVVFLRKTLKNLEKEIETYSDDIKVLNAEWSSLNDPARLKRLCKKYLKDMKPIENSQIMSYDIIMNSAYEEKKQTVDAFDSFIDDALKTENSMAEG